MSYISCKMLAISLSLASLGASAVAHSIAVSYPLANQYPPIARADQPFSWTISPTTFTLDDRPGLSSQLTYATDGLPEWLNFDSYTHSFTGTPPFSAVNSPATIIVTVSTNDSSTSATDSLTLITLDSQPPYVAHPIYAQLTDPANPALSGAFQLHPNSALPPASAGGGVPGLRLPPSWSFSIGIRGDTFLSPSGHSLFYSTSPLPPWVTFNPWTYTFDGITPSTSGEQVEIVVRGSERKGYSDPTAEERFWISVASEELHLSGPASRNGTLTANVTAGEHFEIHLPNVIENGSLWDSGKEQKLGSVFVDISSYSWLQYDASSMTISGTTPTNPPDIQVPISVSDSQMPPQTVNASFAINVLPSFFKSLSYDLPLAFGSSLSVDFSRFVASPDSLGRARRHLIVLTVTGAQSWMSFNPTNLTLTGTAPSIVRDSPVPLGLTQSPEHSVGAPLIIENEHDAVVASSGTSSVTPIKVIFTALDTDSQTTSHFTLNVLLSPAAGSTAEAPKHPDQDQKDKTGSNRGKVVALSVVFGLLLLAVIVGLLFCSLKNGSLLAFCGFFKRDRKEKPLPPYFVDQRSLDGDTLASGHYDLEKGAVAGILKKSGERGGLAAEDNRKVSFALETPRPSTDVGHDRSGASISSGSHYPDDSSGASAVPPAIKVVRRPSMDATTSESIANGPNPYILADVSNGTSHQSAGRPFLAPPAALRSNTSTPARPSIDSTSSGSHYASSGSKYPTSSNASTPSRLIHAFTAQSSSPAPSGSSPGSSSSPKFSFMDRLRQFPLPSIPVPSFASTIKDENARRRVLDEDGKLVISRPRPLMPSLGARLAAEYQEQQEAAKKKITELTRVTGATIVPDSEGNRSYPTPGASRAPSPLDKGGLSKNGAEVTTLPTVKEKSIPFPLHQPLPSAADLGRETDAGALASSSGSSSGLSSSSSGTLGGEVPMRRSDFLSDSDKAKRSPQLSPKGSPAMGHNRGASQDSSASLTLEGTGTMGQAVISKAALAVRSPTVAIPVVAVGNGNNSGQRKKVTVRVVQFDEGHSVEGSSKQYSGKREQSQKAVVMDGSGSKLALKVQELRKQHAEKERTHATVVKVPHHPEPLRLAPEPKDLQDPKVAMGVHYVPRTVAKFGSDENMSDTSTGRASAIFFTSPPSAMAIGFSPDPRYIIRIGSEGETMGVALSGSEESLEASGVTAGKARIISSVPLIRSRQQTTKEMQSISFGEQMHAEPSG